MAKSKDNFSHAATILHIKDMAKSLNFYTSQLGFSLKFTWKDPIEYAVLKRGAISLHLSLGNADGLSKSKRTSLYIFVYDIDKAHEEINSTGASTSTLEEQEYEMKEFFLHDPDGYLITIGQGSGT